MSSAAAKRALYELLCKDPELGTPADELAGLVVKVFKGEPSPGVAPKPSAVTILTGEETATDYTFTVSIYIDNAPATLAAQDAMDAARDAVSSLLASSDTYGRSLWSRPQYVLDYDAWFSSADVEVGRVDF